MKTYECWSKPKLQKIADLEAEIQRLKEAGKAISEQLKIAVREKLEKDQLITELCDALEPYAGPDSTGLIDLHAGQIIQRAREATR